MYYSHFFLTGVLDDELLIKYLPNGVPFTTLWIKVTKPYFAGGSLVTEVSRVPVKVFGKYAENFAAILHIGISVSVEGEIRSFDWHVLEDTDGEDRSYKIVELVSTRIRISEHVMAGE